MLRTMYFLVLASLLLGAVCSKADVLVMTGGKELEGTVTHDAKTDRYILTTPSGIQMAFDRSSVKEIRRSTQPSGSRHAAPQTRPSAIKPANTAQAASTVVQPEHDGVPKGTLADSNGQMIMWGRNVEGQCNLPAETYIAVAAGGANALGIKSDRTLVQCGYNAFGQLQGKPSGTFRAIAVGGYHSVAMRSNGTLAAWGMNNHRQTIVPRGPFKAIAAGYYQCLALRDDGTVAAWGEIKQAPAGNFIAIACGGYHNLAIRTDGTLVGWGNNCAGQTNTPAGSFAAVSGGYYWSLGMRPDGTLVAWGDNTYGQCNVPSSTFVAIAAGAYHGFALRPDGTLTAWGRNEDGQANVPTGNFVAIAAGDAQNVALRGRTDYDGKLLVSGTGVTANLNRSVKVAATVLVDTTMSLYNDPTLTAAMVTINPTAQVVGQGKINGPTIVQGTVKGTGDGMRFLKHVSGAGTYGGLVKFADGFAPGNGLGRVSLENVVFEPGNVLTMEIAGSKEAECDHLDITGTATLGGTLEVRFANDFKPSEGQSFDLFDGTLSGSFKDVRMPELPAGLSWDLSRLYSKGTVSVVRPQAPDPQPLPPATPIWHPERNIPLTCPKA